jgi:Flp pilus assembly protein TadB
MIAGMLPAIATGALAGGGIVVIIAAARPAPVRLDATLASLEASQPLHTGGRPSAEAALGQWLAAHLARPGRLAIPRADLALMGQTPETFLVRKVAAGLAGLVSFTLAAAVLALGGITLPWEVPAAASLAVGAGMFFLPDADLRAGAARRRRDFRYAWCSYLQLVRLACKAGAGTNDALESAASVGDGWVFARIHVALSTARAGHEPLWQGLMNLGTEIGAAEVCQVAETIRVAGSEGTKIADTLAAAAESLRQQLTTEARARANSRTAAMVVPLTLLGLGFILLMAYPPFYQLLQSTP